MPNASLTDLFLFYVERGTWDVISHVLRLRLLVNFFFGSALNTTQSLHGLVGAKMDMVRADVIGEADRL
jgi:hypothetical protein